MTYVGCGLDPPLLWYTESDKSECSCYFISSFDVTTLTFLEFLELSPHYQSSIFIVVLTVAAARQVYGQVITTKFENQGN